MNARLIVSLHAASLRSAHAFVLLALALAFPFVVRAAPPCVDVVLPGTLPDREEWQARITLETSTIRVPEASAAACAEVAIIDEGDGALSVMVRFREHMSRSALALDDVLPLHHARVAALVAQALLRAVADAPVEKIESVANEPQAPTPRIVRDPEPPVRRPPERADRALHVLLGTRLFLGHLPPLGRAELTAQWAAANPSRFRYVAGVIADLTTASADAGRLVAGSFGLRAGAALALLDRAGRRLWLGPHAEANALVTSADARGPGSRTRDVGLGAVSVDLRLSAEFLKRKRLRPVVALDLGGVLRGLHVRAGDDTLVSYAGVYAGLAFGSAIDF